MITKNSVILAEPIVLGHEKNLWDGSSAIIKGLIELSHGAMPYGDHYRDEIVEITADNGHTEILEQVTTSLADAIRATFGQITDYGIGFAKALERELSNWASHDTIVNDATNNLKIEFVNLDNDFLISTLYPTGPKNVQFEYNNIDMSVLSRLQFNNELCRELANTYIDTQHPDITAVMGDVDCHNDEAFYTIMDPEALHSMFVTNGKNIDFTAIKSFRLPLLFKMYVILSKMYASDDPIKSLSGGTLTDYREYVSLLWNGLSTYLAALKQRINVFRGRGIAIHQNQAVELRSGERRFEYTNDVFKYTRLEGSVTVFYTKPVVDTLSQGHYCLRDWVIGRLLCNLKGKTAIADSALLSGPLLEETLSEFYRVIRDGMNEKERELVEFLFERATVTFVNGNERLRTCATEMEGPGSAGEKIVDRMNADFKNGHNLAVYKKSHPEMSDLDVILSSGIVTRFLRAINCHLAADILKSTEHQSGNDDQVEKRKRLHYAVTKVLANKLLG